MNDAQFRQLLNRFGFSWSGYRKVRKGVKKRITRYMEAMEFRNMAELLEELDRNDAVRHQCELLMTVSISRFFRDRELWRSLEKDILPECIEGYRDKIMVWSAGCACGEEAYSFKIVWDCLSNRYLHFPELEIVATDINPSYLDRAMAGIYPFSSLKDASKEVLCQYFKEKRKRSFEIRDSLKKGISWKIHHLLSNPPEIDFDIIFLRNSVLTYYEEELKRKALRNVLQHLVFNGLLIIGSHEAIPFETKGLTSIEPYPCILKKR